MSGKVKSVRNTARRNRAGTNDTDTRQRILDATEQLLNQRRLDELAVADIMAKAGVSRASFYFYFEGKHAVLAELVRIAMAEARQTAEPWLQHQGESLRERLRRGTLEGAKLWRKHAGVLRGIVENWRTAPELTTLWSELMDGFVQAATERIEHDQRAGLAPNRAVSARDLASALCWLDERIFYLAAIDVPPFDRDEIVVEALTDVWLAAVYGTLPPGQ